MRSLTRPFGLLVTSLILSLVFANPVLAFECTNAGAGFTAPDDGGFSTRTACGDAAVASGSVGTAVGADATASGSSSTAVGRLAEVSGNFSTAVGVSAMASVEDSIALGAGAVAGGPQSTAVGESATASGTGSTALGQSATASLIDNTAVGESATASGAQSTALGRASTSSGGGSTAVGVIAVAAGIQSTGLGGGSTASGDHSTAVGTISTASGSFNTALGFASRAWSPRENATALGYRAQVEQSNAMVLGSIPGVNDNLGDNEYVDVGIGTTKPDAPLHIFRDDETLEFMFLESDAVGAAQDRAMMQLNNNGGIRFQFDNTLTGNAWRFQAGTGNQDNFEITSVGSGQLELLLQNDGDLFITGSLTQNSDVNAKQDIEATDGHLILAKLDAVPIAEWTYKRDTSGARHLGPMAQDFHAAFGLGEDETKIAPGDMAGISLAAIKALNTQHEKAIEELKKDKDAELAAQQNQIIALVDRLDKLESLLQGLNKPTAGL